MAKHLHNRLTNDLKHTLNVLAVEIVASVAHLVAVVQRLGVLNVLLPVESLQRHRVGAAQAWPVKRILSGRLSSWGRL